MAACNINNISSISFMFLYASDIAEAKPRVEKDSAFAFIGVILL